MGKRHSHNIFEAEWQTSTTYLGAQRKVMSADADGSESLLDLHCKILRGMEKLMVPMDSQK